MTPGWIPRKLPLALALPLWIWVPSILGEYRWAILFVCSKPIPVRHDAVVFPKFLTTDKTLELPYLPFDPTQAPLGENRSLSEQGSLCFQIDGTGGCIKLTGRALGMFDAQTGGRVRLTQDASNPKVTITNMTFWQEAIWVNGTFLSRNVTDRERPRQPRIAAPHCSPEDEGRIPSWNDCQSSSSRWADQDGTFSFSPNMMLDPGEYLAEFRPRATRQGLFLQDLRMHPFHKWVLCGINGSCTELKSLGLYPRRSCWQGLLYWCFKIFSVLGVGVCFHGNWWNYNYECKFYYRDHWVQ